MAKDLQLFLNLPQKLIRVPNISTAITALNQITEYGGTLPPRVWVYCDYDKFKNDDEVVHHTLLERKRSGKYGRMS